MRKPVLTGCGLLMAALIVGCGSSDDAIVKEQISLMNEMTAVFEKVTDAASFKDAEKQIQNLKKRAEEIEAKTKSWSEDKKKTVAQKYEKELKASAEKMAGAMMAAAMKATGGGLDKLKLPPLP
jgi:hypothetical protein